MITEKKNKGSDDHEPVIPGATSYQITSTLFFQKKSIFHHFHF